MISRNEVLVSRSIPPPVTTSSFVNLMVPIDWPTIGLVACTTLFLSLMIALYDLRKLRPVNFISYVFECVFRMTGLLLVQAKDQYFIDRTLSSNVLIAVWLLGCTVLVGYYNSFILANSMLHESTVFLRCNSIPKSNFFYSFCQS